MEYDPIKDYLGDFFRKSPLLQRIFFALLHLFFLRAWHVKKILRGLFSKLNDRTPIQVLDAGTGFAQYAYFMAKSFPKANILAVDIKQDYLDNAAAFFAQTPHRSRIDFAFEDLTALQAKGPFDLILSVDVMEHIEDDRAVFRNFANVLNEGGFVVINTPSDQGGSDVSGEDEDSFIGEHVRDGYNIDELQDKLRDAGLKPVDARFTYGTYGSFAWRFLIKYPMMMLSTSKLFLLLLPLYYIPVFPIGMLLNWLDVRVHNKTGTGVLVVATR